METTGTRGRTSAWGVGLGIVVTVFAVLTVAWSGRSRSRSVDVSSPGPAATTNVQDVRAPETREPIAIPAVARQSTPAVPPTRPLDPEPERKQDPREGQRVLVLDPLDHPVPDARCTLWIDDELRAQASTDRDGRCTLEVSDGLRGFLAVVADEFAPSWQATVLEEGSELVVKLVRGVQLAVQVQKASGAPIDGARIEAEWERVGSDDPVWEPWRATTDATGTALLGPLPVHGGRLVVTARARFFSAARTGVPMGGASGPQPVDLVLEAAGDLRVFLRDELGVTHDGQVEVNAGPQAGLLPASRFDIGRGGTWIPDLPVGRIELLGSICGAPLGQVEVTVKPGRVNQVDVPFPALVYFGVIVVGGGDILPDGMSVTLTAEDDRRGAQWAGRGPGARLVFRQTLMGTRSPLLWVTPGSYWLDVLDPESRSVHRQKVAITSRGDVQVNLGRAPIATSGR